MSLKRKKKVSFFPDKSMHRDNRFRKLTLRLLGNVAPQDDSKNDVGVKPLHRFPIVEERWDSWEPEDDMERNYWNEDFNRQRSQLLERHSSLFDKSGQLSPPGANEMLEQIKKTVENVLTALKTTEVKNYNQEVFVTLHPFDRIRFTNLGATLFTSALMLILLGSNNKLDLHSERVMDLLMQGITMDEEMRVEKKKREKNLKKTEREGNNI